MPNSFCVKIVDIIQNIVDKYKFHFQNWFHYNFVFNQGRHFRFFQGEFNYMCLFSYFSAVQDSYFIKTLTFQKIRRGGGGKCPLKWCPCFQQLTRFSSINWVRFISKIYKCRLCSYFHSLAMKSRPSPYPLVVSGRRHKSHNIPPGSFGEFITNFKEFYGLHNILICPFPPSPSISFPSQAFALPTPQHLVILVQFKVVRSTSIILRGER